MYSLTDKGMISVGLFEMLIILENSTTFLQPWISQAVNLTTTSSLNPIIFAYGDDVIIYRLVIS